MVPTMSEHRSPTRDARFTFTLTPAEGVPTTHGGTARSALDAARALSAATGGPVVVRRMGGGAPQTVTAAAVRATLPAPA